MALDSQRLFCKFRWLRSLSDLGDTLVEQSVGAVDEGHVRSRNCGKTFVSSKDSRFSLKTTSEVCETSGFLNFSRSSQ